MALHTQGRYNPAQKNKVPRMGPTEMLTLMILGVMLGTFFIFVTKKMPQQYSRVGNIRQIIEVPVDWTEPYFYSSDPSVVGVHPVTGKLQFVYHGEVILCAQKSVLETEPTKCKVVTYQKSPTEPVEIDRRPKTKA